MNTPLDLATMIGAYVVAVGTILAAWTSYHWHAIRQRQVNFGSFIELALLVLFACVVAAWLMNMPW
jgi:hypothetical protein